METVVAVSGGFDPVHIGHVRLLKEAKKLGNKLVVILNNDNWLKSKKGYTFMPQKDRKEILEEFECVDEVVLSFHDDNSKDLSICSELEVVAPDIFANGGDRNGQNIPEKELCKELGIKCVYNIGGEKIRSSSELVKKVKR